MTIQEMMNVLMEDSPDGQVFRVEGYRDSKGGVRDIEFLFMPPGGYRALQQDTIRWLEEGRGDFTADERQALAGKQRNLMDSGKLGNSIGNPLPGRMHSNVSIADGGAVVYLSSLREVGKERGPKWLPIHDYLPRLKLEEGKCVRLAKAGC